LIVQCFFDRDFDQPIDVMSESLPVVKDESTMPIARASRILVVEDDISVRQLTTEMLVRCGYEVDIGP
jgi:hypothetical protein